MGGVGGFFAQKCVEVDAQAAPRIDVYDDDQPVSGCRSCRRGFAPRPRADEPFVAPEPEAFIPPAPELRPAPAGRRRCPSPLPLPLPPRAPRRLSSPASSRPPRTSTSTNWSCP